MGNRLCKKKSGDIVDSPKAKDKTFDRIITRLHLRPNSWKSETQLSKQVNRPCKSKSECRSELENSKPLSRSTDWIEASLEVPEKDSPIHLRNPKLALIFNHEDTGTPTPPPRKHKKGIREKIEAVAKSGLQALQLKKPVEEPLCIKKTVNYNCPCDRLNHKHNHHDHNHTQEKNIINKELQKLEHSKKTDQMKESKRKKNLSVVSLPNYNELKFSVANFNDIDEKTNSDEKCIKSSNVSLPGDTKKGRINYMIRCRSFGSLLPQQLLEKLKPSSKTADIESDDSFGPLEDWDLGLLEHYNPRDASLPRPRKPTPKSEAKVLSDIEGLILKEDVSPTPPIRITKAPIVETKYNTGSANYPRTNEFNHIGDTNFRFTQENRKGEGFPEKQVSENEDKVEHSTLMKILEEFSIKDKLNNKEDLKEADSGKIIATPGSDLNANLREVKLVNEFIRAEKLSTGTELQGI